MASGKPGAVQESNPGQQASIVGKLKRPENSTFRPYNNGERTI
jgi:hypothetical protein